MDTLFILTIHYTVPCVDKLIMYVSKLSRFLQLISQFLITSMMALANARATLLCAEVKEKKIIVLLILVVCSRSLEDNMFL